MAPAAPVALIRDPLRLARYERPERGEPGQASALLLPDTPEQVGAVLGWAQAQRQPLVLSAGRTGLVEAQRPEGEAVLSLERLNRVLALHLADGSSWPLPATEASAAAVELAERWQAAGRPALAGAALEVEAGLAVDALNALLEPLGCLWPMEMGSTASASVGACAANGSAGANALCYGTAAHLVVAVSGYWADGRPTGWQPGLRWTLPAADQLAIDSARLDPARGLLTTQGVFGVITRLRLRLYPRPLSREAVLLALPDMPAAMRLLAAARARFGEGVEEFEFLHQGALALGLAHLNGAVRLPHQQPQAPWHLLLQLCGEQPGEALAAALYEFLLEQGLAESAIGYAPLAALKRLRHSLTEASNARMRALGGGRLSFDTATPLARFGDYLEALRADLAPRGVELVAFGHAGVGGAHLHLLGSRDQPVGPRAAELVERVFDLTQAHGGTFSAEHGVGSKWAAQWQARTPAEEVQALRAEKRRRDPAGILQPRCFALVEHA